jgi:DNA-binding IclR family transcriptional regulator
MVKSANRVIQILNTVGTRKEGLTNAELSQALNIPKGSLSLLLADLVQNEFLHLMKENKRYILGSQIIVLAGQYLTDLDIVQAGRPIVHEVMIKTEESCALAVRKEDDMVIVFGENSPQPIKRAIEIGYRAPLYRTAGGKAILAFSSDLEIDQYLSSVHLVAMTRTTITDTESLKKELKKIRSHFFAYSKEEQYEGLSAIATPIFDLHGSVSGSIVVTLPTSRVKPMKKKLVEKTLYRASEALSRKLGFNAASGKSRKAS